jgi:hypothetical protein
MNQESLKLTGRVVSVNAAEQSFLIESIEKSNRLRVYADDKTFKKLNRTFQSAGFNGARGKEPAGIFHIQGRVLIYFNLPSWLDVVRAFGALKYSPENRKKKSLAERYPALTALVNREDQSK